VKTFSSLGERAVEGFLLFQQEKKRERDKYSATKDTLRTEGLKERGRELKKVLFIEEKGVPSQKTGEEFLRSEGSDSKEARGSRQGVQRKGFSKGRSKKETDRDKRSNTKEKFNGGIGMHASSRNRRVLLREE